MKSPHARSEGTWKVRILPKRWAQDFGYLAWGSDRELLNVYT